MLKAKRLASAATNPLGELILARVLEGYPENLTPITSKLKERMDILAHFIDAREEISWCRPPYGSVSFPKLDIPITTMELAERLVNEHGVFVIPGEFFGHEGHLRLGIGNVDPGKALEGIANVLDSLA